MDLWAGNVVLTFTPVRLEFREQTLTNIFAKKNNRTVAETLGHKRYTLLAAQVEQNYPQALSEKLGDFLFGLKQAGDPFYRRFLNKYGDEGAYCTFSITDPLYWARKGLYLYVLNGEVKYVGKTEDTFKKRINGGYGTIHPKNCYLDGQATNCHLNALIAQHRERVEFYLCPLDNNSDISEFEGKLIQSLNPSWNIMLKRDQTLATPKLLL